MRIKNLGFALTLLMLAGSCLAAGTTITVITKLDEKNPNQTSANGPKNQGCSLREAIQTIDLGSNSTYPQCASPSGGAPYVIDLTNAGGTIVINGLVKDPSDPAGVAMTRSGGMPDIFAVGAVTVMGGDITCDTGANSERIFNVAAGGNFTLSGVKIHDCTAFGSGIGVSSNASGGSSQLTLVGTTFDTVKGTSGSPGGAVSHGSGTLTINGGAFTNCSQDDGAGGGQGGALSIGSVSLPDTVNINAVSFLNNTAGQSGGAVYISSADSITMSNLIFTNNSAKGDSGSNAEYGGGAIWAGNPANSGLPTSFFLLFNDQFLNNSAPNGTGGAIVLSGGNLSYGSFNFGSPTIPGGIVASNFNGNSAGGPAPVGIDPRSGSGGAIYATGNLSIEQSSFVATPPFGANTSKHGSGGAIAYYDATGNNTLKLVNTTINGSKAALSGGALANLLGTTSEAGHVELINDTLDSNTASGVPGGGAFFNGNSDPTQLSVSNTIFSNSGGSGANCAGQPFPNSNTNLQFPGTTCGIAMLSADPKLNGPSIFAGPNLFVFTQSLMLASAASGTGTQSICSAGPVLKFDGTGAPLTRPSPSGSQCDIGAFESTLAPDLKITKSHADPFTVGDTGDTYTIAVSNIGNDFTSGSVTVTDTLPAGLTATAIDGGPNWNCTLATLTCTRIDTLANGGSYENIMVTVDVAPTATPGAVTNTATVSGGGDSTPANDSFGDLTNIKGIPVLAITKTHVDPFMHGQTGDTYTITVSNDAVSSTAATSGTVTVTDTLPLGLTATAITGTGWSGCTAMPVVGPGTLSCSRSDALPIGNAYPQLTLTVNVASNAPSPTIINSVTVSGGGAANATANDQTTTPVMLQSFSVE